MYSTEWDVAESLKCQITVGVVNPADSREPLCIPGQGKDIESFSL